MSGPTGGFSDVLLSPENGVSAEETLENEKLEEEEEEKEEEISDKPDVSGTSLLNPDPSLGCFPRGLRDFKPRGSSCAAHEENPGTKAWNYLLRRNIIELLEIATTEMIHRRIPDPIDFLIAATAEARAEWQEKLLESAKLRCAEAEAARAAASVLRTAAAGDDGASPHSDPDEAADDLPRDPYSSVVTPSSSVNLDRISCFPNAADAIGFDFEALERRLKPPGSGARPIGVCGRPPNQVTSEEALKLLSYLL